MQQTIFYNSPVGVLRISCDGESINEVCFVKEDEVEVKEKVEVEQSPVLSKCVEQLDKYFSGETRVFDVMLDQEGTLFQKRVWNTLCEIPFGKTLSYMELSKRLGDTKAIRAVGTANGRNNIAIIVPCHRVIGSNGSLVGYAGELWRKKWLLEHEAKHANGVRCLF